MPSKRAVAVSRVGLTDGVAAQRVGDDVAHVVALGEEDFDRADAGFDDLVQLLDGEFLVGFHQDFAGGGVDHVGGGHGAVQFSLLDLDFADLVGAQRFEDRRCDLATTACAGFAPSRCVGFSAFSSRDQKRRPSRILILSTV
jgi:hypothetical protein